MGPWSMQEIVTIWEVLKETLQALKQTYAPQANTPFVVAVFLVPVGCVIGAFWGANGVFPSQIAEFRFWQYR